MAGYFYNDGKVREVTGATEILAAAEGGPVPLLAGPSERRRLEGMGGREVHALTTGVRRNTQLRVERRE